MSQVFFFPPIGSANVTPPVGGFATASNQALEIADLSAIEASNAAIEISAAAIAAGQAGAATAANQVLEIADLAAIAASTAAGATAANQTTANADLATIVTNTGSSSTSNSTAAAVLTARLSGSFVPMAYDEVDLVYVAAGNGVGQIQKATYKLATATVATLTLTYDGSNRISTVVRT